MKYCTQVLCLYFQSAFISVFPDVSATCTLHVLVPAGRTVDWTHLVQTPHGLTGPPLPNMVMYHVLPLTYSKSHSTTEVVFHWLLDPILKHVGMLIQSDHLINCTQFDNLNKKYCSLHYLNLLFGGKCPYSFNLCNTFSMVWNNLGYHIYTLRSVYTEDIQSMKVSSHCLEGFAHRFSHELLIANRVNFLLNSFCCLTVPIFSLLPLSSASALPYVPPFCPAAKGDVKWIRYVTSKLNNLVNRLLMQSAGHPTCKMTRLSMATDQWVNS